MKERILVIEDNENNFELMAYLLKSAGYEVTGAEDGQSGLKKAQAETPALIVCDIHIPVLDGMEVVRRLKDDPALRGIPVIAVTALAMVGDRDRILAAGFDGYIGKPIEPELFIPTIAGFLGHKSAAPRAPAPTPGNARSGAPKAAAPVGVGTCILVLDDVADNIAVVKSTLEPFGYEIVAAGSVDAAMAAARQRTPDLILSDLHMPRKDGYALLRAVQAEPALRRIPVIIHSATYSDKRDAETALSLGAERFIHRPIDPERLLDEIAACMRKKRG